MKKNTQSLIFTPQVMRRVSTVKEFANVKALEPPSKVKALINDYNLGPKTGV